MTLQEYRTRQAESFASVGTTAADWKVCRITGLITGDIPSFESLPPYDEVTPIYNKLVKELGREAAAEYIDRVEGSGQFRLCQLCGCPKVKHPCPIQCDSKELLMYIGSECVTNYMDADENIARQVRLYKEKRIRELFDDWVYNGIQQCYLYRDFHESIWIGYKRFQKKLRVAEENIKSYGALKIKNLFKQAYELGLTIPKDPQLEFSGYRADWLNTATKHFRKRKSHGIKRSKRFGTGWWLSGADKKME